MPSKAGIRYKAPKSGHSRTVALPATAVAELKAHRIAQAQELLKFGKRLSEDGFIVAQPDGSPLRPHSLGQMWTRFLADHPALPRIRYHDLRHTHATHMLCVHPKIQRTLGPFEDRDYIGPLQPRSAEHAGRCCRDC